MQNNYFRSMQIKFTFVGSWVTYLPTTQHFPRKSRFSWARTHLRLCTFRLERILSELSFTEIKLLWHREIYTYIQVVASSCLNKRKKRLLFICNGTCCIYIKSKSKSKSKPIFALRSVSSVIYRSDIRVSDTCCTKHGVR